MSLEVLLLSNDLALLNTIRRVCDDSSIVMRLAADAVEAEGMLSKGKFDGVIVDCDEIPGSVSVIQNLRKGASNRSAVAFVIRNGHAITVRNAFEAGANFVLDKPVNVDRATRCMRAAHGLLIRERRRYFRVPVDFPVELSFGDGVMIEAKVTNLSEGGISVRSPHALSKAPVKVSFFLPGTKTKIEAKAEVSWTAGDSCQGGVRFIYMSDSMQQEVAIWLNRALQEVDPVLLMNVNRGWAKMKNAESNQT